MPPFFSEVVTAGSSSITIKHHPPCGVCAFIIKSWYKYLLVLYSYLTPAVALTSPGTYSATTSTMKNSTSLKVLPREE